VLSNYQPSVLRIRVLAAVDRFPLARRFDDTEAD
jgi:hypothetical protein